jgi:predicted flap endonuclease-1-like 5' DNA nuclease
MSILQKIKQVFGLSTAGAETESPGEGGTDVTIEREPDHDDAGSEAGLGGETGSETAAEETTVDAGAGSDVEAETETELEPEAEDKVEASDAESEPEAGPGADPVDVINGIGPTYSDRLADVNIGTVADLAEADPETVADAAKTGESKAMSWIDRAKDRLS